MILRALNRIKSNRMLISNPNTKFTKQKLRFASAREAAFAPGVDIPPAKRTLHFSKGNKNNKAYVRKA
jgi:hypothetical protein